MLLEKPDEAKGLTWQGELWDGYGSREGNTRKTSKRYEINIIR